jgi:hypothetical protein
MTNDEGWTDAILSRLWPANWTLGLTGKSTQNVLRGDPNARRAYVSEFERAVADSGAKCRADIRLAAMGAGLKRETMAHTKIPKEG